MHPDVLRNQLIAGEEIDFRRQEFGPDRTIPADLLASLLLDAAASDRQQGRTVGLSHARIIGPLDLTAATLPFPVVLKSCSFSDDLSLEDAIVSSLKLLDCQLKSVNASHIEIHGDLVLGAGTVARTVTLVGAKIGGLLDCTGGTFSGYTDPSRSMFGRTMVSINAEGMSVKGQVTFGKDFQANELVILAGAEIGGRLYAEDAQLKGIFADSMTVGSILWASSTIRGEARLLSAKVHGSLECRTAQFLP